MSTSRGLELVLEDDAGRPNREDALLSLNDLVNCGHVPGLLCFLPRTCFPTVVLGSDMENRSVQSSWSLSGCSVLAGASRAAMESTDALICCYFLPPLPGSSPCVASP